VGRPETVTVAAALNKAAGTGFRAYPQLVSAYGKLTLHDDVLPRAIEIALLGAAELAAGRGKAAVEAQPVYVRDNVAVAKRPS
jgi:tRNA threonylcarbamoyladenosine biosynthesis protein TsaB